MKFEGVLKSTPRGGGGTLVPIPREVTIQLGLKGMPKIQAVIAGTPYRGSLMPMGDGTGDGGVAHRGKEARDAKAEVGGRGRETETGEADRLSVAAGALLSC